MRLAGTLILVVAAALAAVPCAAQQPRSSGAPLAEADSLLALASQSRVKGDADAPVTIIELSDFQCPFCREFTRGALPALDSAYIRTGKAKLVFVNLPLPMHGQAFGAAEAALCAGAQGKFWPMHDRIFAGQEQWSGSAGATAHFAAYARELGLDPVAFGTCTAEDRMAPLILGDAMQAAGSGATSTPTFVIDGTRVLSGAQPFAEFQKLIEEALAGGR